MCMHKNVLCKYVCVCVDVCCTFLREDMTSVENLKWKYRKRHFCPLQCEMSFNLLTAPLKGFYYLCFTLKYAKFERLRNFPNVNMCLTPKSVLLCCKYVLVSIISFT